MYSDKSCLWSMLHRHDDNVEYWVKSWDNDTACSKCLITPPDDIITQYILIGGKFGRRSGKVKSFWVWHENKHEFSMHSLK